MIHAAPGGPTAVKCGMIQTVATETLPEIASASAAGTIEIEREIETEDETAEGTDRGHENDVITREIAQCHRISTDKTVGGTEIEAAEIVAQDEMEIGGTALVDRTIGMTVMTLRKTNDPNAKAKADKRSPSPARRDRGSRRDASPSPARMEQDEYDDDIEVEGQDDDDVAAMQAMMGFGGFGTTKGKKVAGNNAGGVRKEKKSEYRQYMNRQGGFNRPLSPSR
ncbi:uncharacterized protein Triagg1_7969 [Trichoderma aggressivum f. europaeum]|uniref:U4/U6.U5 small nuclear ribonucleoprotein 27kDa protein domain-containing protein n=1 Tax=Trichoderma aggressivum f. europaeum TaxID=173218 RepID=A0AAE1M0D3_9HYPO|nr:hypothetical protein Triagg1_7969 [Trichoderma aggressivum f. europaeum]